MGCRGEEGRGGRGEEEGRGGRGEDKGRGGRGEEGEGRQGRGGAYSNDWPSVRMGVWPTTPGEPEMPSILVFTTMLLQLM